MVSNQLRLVLKPRFNSDPQPDSMVLLIKLVSKVLYISATIESPLKSCWNHSNALLTFQILQFIVRATL